MIWRSVISFGTPSIYTGLTINHVASISYGVLGGVIWMNTGGPQAVFLLDGAATAGAGLVARHMDAPLRERA